MEKCLISAISLNYPNPAPTPVPNWGKLALKYIAEPSQNVPILGKFGENGSKMLGHFSPSRKSNSKRISKDVFPKSGEKPA